MELKIESLERKLESIHKLCKINIPKIHIISKSCVFISTIADVSVIKNLYQKNLVLYGFYIIKSKMEKLKKVEETISSWDDQRTVIKLKKNGKSMIIFEFDHTTKDYVEMYCTDDDNIYSMIKFIITREHMNILLNKLKGYFEREETGTIEIDE